MRQKTIIIFRDIANLLLFFGTLYIITWYSYNSIPELVLLKNYLLPIKIAILLCIITSVTLVIINRITTYITIKIIQRIGED